MKPLILYEIDIPIFNQYFYICNWNKKDFLKYMTIYIWEDVTEEDWKWFTFHKNPHIYSYIWKETYNNTLVHELIHITYAILENKWISESKDNEEVFAYLYTYLYDECKHLNKQNKIKINPETWKIIK